jgi:hypothetical protein
LSYSVTGSSFLIGAFPDISVKIIGHPGVGDFRGAN